MYYGSDVHNHENLLKPIIPLLFIGVHFRILVFLYLLINDQGKSLTILTNVIFIFSDDC